MKKSITALAVSATIAFTATVANASVHPTPIMAPQTVNQVTVSTDTPFGTQKAASEIQMASLARSCSDSRYSWWEYSGWEIVGCLISGQW
ncbi:hypothetical protein SAMN03159355_03461 [Pseudomonas sp. NFPP10]|uniref:hypothetical protein n=1 Tax=Pseudomonas TaxID=286 RepID=UPI0008829C75|nr:MULTISPECIES: hypothetical protein [Pseudomonas]BCQ60541.1 hypothetical protein PBOI14_22910 [Pseudomonas sp. Boi14]POA91780.1 hypothetical protein C1883_01685 [Pseudomonas protegens]PZP04917.1 MAG: hypothetical protein DI621_23265 [Pseudomonas protegens]ROM19565.1 hypothetical protein BK643_02500 [Pseudomonas protegens]SDA26513.1 hypothetical protein SAMN03159465_03928 [Pseudomonas sp. NFPP12]